MTIPANLADKMAELLALEKNWDSYGAPPIDRISLQKVIDFLTVVNTQVPNIWPTSHGWVSLEWEMPDGSISIMFTSKPHQDEDDRVIFIDEDEE